MEIVFETSILTENAPFIIVYNFHYADRIEVANTHVSFDASKTFRASQRWCVGQWRRKRTIDKCNFKS